MTDLERLTLIKKAVEMQAEDPTLWVYKPTIGEAYLQQSLRWLHRVVEDPDKIAQSYLIRIEDQAKDNI